MAPMPVSEIIAVFNKRLGGRYGVRLEGGGAEPFYQAPKAAECGLIVFRADYSASALHEVAHWCVAGPNRRRLPDYGYWYSPDDRDITKQTAFFGVEAKPQALESFFCAAAGIKFTASIDNLSLKIPQSLLEQFHNKLRYEQDRLERNGLPMRAARFSKALHRARRQDCTACPTA